MSSPVGSENQAAMSEKPLHVRVAEALGCVPVGPPKYRWDSWCCVCKVRKDEHWGPHTAHVIHSECCHSHSGLNCDNDLARYDTDWSATGPLIERYGIGLIKSYEPSKSSLRWHACTETGESCSYGSCGPAALGETPLLAVCNLILALKAAGKLL